MARILQSMQHLISQYGMHVPLLFFILGVLWDSITLWRPDGLFENLTFAAYLLVTTLIIFILPLFERRHDERAGIMIAVLQFCFGNLAGGLMILYMRSGTLVGSALFLFSLLALIIANEALKTRYRAHALRIGVWYALLTLYISMALPILYERMGTDVFVNGLLTAFIIAFLFVCMQRALRFIARPQDWFVSVGVIALVTIFFFVAHITHIMPPVPLALRSAGIAHSAVHIDDIYRLQIEDSKYPLFMETSSHFHTALPSRSYCFSEVYAPSKLVTALQHHWEFYDVEKKEWSTIVTVPYSIFGGRDKGFRGYSYISLRKYGEYRCTIETDKGVIVGRRTFTVEVGNPILTEVDL